MNTASPGTRDGVHEIYTDNTDVYGSTTNIPLATIAANCQSQASTRTNDQKGREWLHQNCGYGGAIATS